MACNSCNSTVSQALSNIQILARLDQIEKMFLNERTNQKIDLTSGTRQELNSIATDVSNLQHTVNFMTAPDSLPGLLEEVNQIKQMITDMPTVSLHRYPVFDPHAIYKVGDITTYTDNTIRQYAGSTLGWLQYDQATKDTLSALFTLVRTIVEPTYQRPVEKAGEMSFHLIDDTHLRIIVMGSDKKVRETTLTLGDL